MAGAKDLALPYSDLWQRFTQFFWPRGGPFLGISATCLVVPGGDVDRSAATVAHKTTRKKLTVPYGGATNPLEITRDSYQHVQRNASKILTVPSSLIGATWF